MQSRTCRPRRSVPCPALDKLELQGYDYNSTLLLSALTTLSDLLLCRLEHSARLWVVRIVSCLRRIARGCRGAFQASTFFLKLVCACSGSPFCSKKDRTGHHQGEAAGRTKETIARGRRRCTAAGCNPDPLQSTGREGYGRGSHHYTIMMGYGVL